MSTLRTDNIATLDGSINLPVGGFLDRGNHVGDIPASDITGADSITGVFNANDYGFSLTGTSSERADAIEAAVAAAGGGRVVVQADADFTLSQVSLSNTPFNIEFRGNGRIDRRGSTSQVFVATADYASTQAATLNIESNVVIDGSTTDQLVRVDVADGTAYGRDDIVKIFSDDIDPDASSSVARRQGEFAVVIAVSGNSVYLANPLEQYDFLSTNVRIAKMPKVTGRIRGMKILSDFSSTGSLVYMRALYRPNIEVEFIEHPDICMSSQGNYCGEWHLAGSGKGDASGQLSYLFNDSNGYHNRVIAPHSRFFRHTTTTNFTAVDAGVDEPYNYGGTVFHEVINGISDGSQGTPWDDHEGARHTRWINCKSLASVDNDATSRVAYGARGRDTTIEGGYVDSNFERAIRVGDYSKGVLRVNNLQSEVCLFQDVTGFTPDDFRVVVQGGYSKSKGLTRCWGNNFSANAEFYNHECHFEFNGQASSSVVRLRRDNQRQKIVGCTFYVHISAASTDARVIQENGASTYDSLVVKDSDFHMSRDGSISYANFIYGRNGPGFGSISAYVYGLERTDATAWSGGFNDGTFGTYWRHSIKHPDDLGQRTENVGTLEDYMTYF